MKCSICNTDTKSVKVVDELKICSICIKSLKETKERIEGIYWKAYQKGWYNLTGLSEALNLTLKEVTIEAGKRGLISERKD